MKIRKPSVGPILGSTTDTVARLFIGGDLELSRGQPRRAHGVVRVRLRRRRVQKFSSPKYFPLSPNFDMTGVGILQNLRADTEYDYQVGWIYSDVDSKVIDIGEGQLDWGDCVERTFRTASVSQRRERSFVVGSCRYLLRLFGGSWFDNRGDKTFRSIVRQIDQDQRRTDAVLMVGDQIYADDLNVVNPDRRVDKFFKRYREAFSTPGISELMSRVPTYMTLDDHEIEDNWPARASSQDYMLKFPEAIHAYQTYQLSHSPLLPIKNGKLSGTPDCLWYSFRDGCADFFVTDTRTERILNKTQRSIIGEEQEAALFSWLNDRSGRVKVIASAVPLFSATDEDKWEGFIEQRDRLLDFVHDNGIRRVVVVSGDVHASFSAELHSKHRSFKVISVVSSSFFWPYPHPARSSFQKNGKLKSNSHNGYAIAKHSNVHTTDSFARVTCSPTRMTVEFYARKGAKLGATTHRF